jgi:hypothetical protein
MNSRYNHRLKFKLEFGVFAKLQAAEGSMGA